MHERHDVHGRQPRDTVVLLAEETQAREQSGRGERKQVIRLEEANQRYDCSRQQAERSRGVAVHLPMRKSPYPVQEEEAQSRQDEWSADEAPEQREEENGEQRELDHHDLSSEPDRCSSQAERNRKQIEGAGKRVNGRVSIELPAVRHDIRELEKVPLVHEARPAVVKGQLEGDGDRRDQ